MNVVEIARKRKSQVLQFLPEERVFEAFHWLAPRRFLHYAQRRLGVDFHFVPPGAAPPAALIAKTSAQDQLMLQRESNSDKYFGGGYRIVLNWLQTLEQISFNVRTIGAVFEFGCGTG